MRTLLALSVAALVLLKGSTTWAVAVEENEKRTFAGIKAIRVLVERMPDGKDKLNLTDEDIESLTELELRKNGVPVTSTLVDDDLYVNVNAIYLESVNGFCYSIGVSLNSTVTRSNGMTVFGAQTWRHEFIGFAPANQTPAAIRENLLKQLIRFSNLYLAANPKGDN